MSKVQIMALQERVVALHDAQLLADEEHGVVEDSIADCIDLLATGSIADSAMVIQSRVAQIVTLSEHMQNDASFARQLKRKFLRPGLAKTAAAREPTESPSRTSAQLLAVELRAELTKGPQKLSVLRKRAIASGASEAQIDEADDSDDVKAALIELVIQTGTTALEVGGMRNRHARSS